MKKINGHLLSIFHAALERVDPYKMVMRRLRIDGSTLLVDDPNAPLSFDLKSYDRIVVIGTGKASAKMALATESVLGKRITEGVISVKYGYTETLDRIEIIEAGHPVPDEQSIRAAARIESLARAADLRTIVINLISGGGSSLLVKPFGFEQTGMKVSLTLDDIQKTTAVLLACGATIEEMNCIRKHLSGIKGGRLAEMIYPATGINLILSDVVGDRLDTIASGLTVADDTTYGEALAIVERYGIETRIPQTVQSVLKEGNDGRLPETPKKNDRAFERCHTVLLGTNHHALEGAGEQAALLGYNTLVLTSQVTGEAREAAKVLLGIGKDIARHGIPIRRPACLISGGETTVTLRGTGKGGRNTELALSFLQGIEQDRKGAAGIYLLSAATDGNDGPTDSAGAYASDELLDNVSGMRIDEYLARNDSNTFFEKAGGLLKTGPTNTNVCDIQLVIVL
jgi:glycerate 2-kinase